MMKVKNSVDVDVSKLKRSYEAVIPDSHEDFWNDQRYFFEFNFNVFRNYKLKIEINVESFCFPQRSILVVKCELSSFGYNQIP